MGTTSYPVFTSTSVIRAEDLQNLADRILVLEKRGSPSSDGSGFYSITNCRFLVPSDHKGPVIEVGKSISGVQLHGNSFETVEVSKPSSPNVVYEIGIDWSVTLPIVLMIAMVRIIRWVSAVIDRGRKCQK